jgi:hypothetical protein
MVVLRLFWDWRHILRLGLGHDIKIILILISGLILIAGSIEMGIFSIVELQSIGRLERELNSVQRGDQTNFTYTLSAKLLWFELTKYRGLFFASICGVVLTIAAGSIDIIEKINSTETIGDGISVICVAIIPWGIACWAIMRKIQKLKRFRQFPV